MGRRGGAARGATSAAWVRGAAPAACMSGVRVQCGTVHATARGNSVNAEEGAELAVLPENFALMAPTESIQALAQHEQQASQLRHFLADQAASLRLWLLGGTLPLPAGDGRSYAASLAYDSDGVCRAEYHKIHLFDADVGDAQQQYRESDSYAPGDQPCVFHSPFGRIGVAVCYDLRFPELFRQMMDPGMDVLLVLSLIHI